MAVEVKQLGSVIKTLKENASHIKVLYVEDDPLIRQEYMAFLSRFFENIESRENGSEGLETALENDYDLIITDVQMPKMNGLDMIQQIKEYKPNQITIIISAYKETDFLHRAIMLGVDGYLFKPLEMDEIVKVLSKTVGLINEKYLNAKYQEELETLVIEKTKEVIDRFVKDKLTGLYSLGKLQQDLQVGHFKSMAVVKIRNFKNLNDFFGYEVGDTLLIQTAQFFMKFAQLKADAGKIELYRVSGAHFVLLADFSSRQLLGVVHELVEEFENSKFFVEDESTMFEMDGGVVDDKMPLTLSNADNALRESQKEKHIYYLEDSFILYEKHKSRLKWIEAIKKAIHEDKIIPYYQPIVDNVSNTIGKYEVLVRMLSTDGEIIPPGSFLNISKETKMYHQITQQVITKALNDFAKSECNISINLSMDDIQNTQIREFLRQKIAAFNDPTRITFEILESEQVLSYADLGLFVNEMHCLGCKIAIDDFGSGYSNFEHLVKLNVDFIKIDGSLISNIDANAASYNIVEMLVNFAKKMKIKTVAEFVSNKEIHTIVSSLGVDESQGYLFSQPIPYDDSMNRVKQLAII